MKRLVVILDPAHGQDVKGKRSPDGKHLEYKWSREICNKLSQELQKLGFRVEFTNASPNEIGLSKRKNIASSIEIHANEFKLLVSLHNNAAGNGESWANARGYEVYTTKGQNKSDKCAEIILNNLSNDFPTFKGRFDMVDGDKDKEENFTVLMGSGYSAVLIEWLFQDNKQDVELLQNLNTNDLLVRSLVKSLEEINDNIDNL